MKKININSYTYVRLTKEGQQVLDRYRAAYRYCPVDKVSGTDYVRIQLWELMQIFGPEMGMGSPVLFETSILFDSKDVEGEIMMLYRSEDNAPKVEANTSPFLLKIS